MEFILDDSPTDYASEKHNFAEVLRPGIRRLDMPDGRTRLHSVQRGEPGDMQGYYDFDAHRVIDRVALTTVLDLWRLDCGSKAEWRDGALDLLIRPGDLRLRIDLARGEYRVGGSDAPWLPIDQLQANIDREIGDGFGWRIEDERRWAEYKAGALERNRVERRKDMRWIIFGSLLFLAALLFQYLDPIGP